MIQTAILLIHGNNSSPNTWNTNSTGKLIEFESALSVKYPVFKANIPDYSQPLPTLISPLLSYFENKNTQWLIICHSLGSLLGLELGRLADKKELNLPIIGLIFLDPTPLDETYREKVQARGWLTFENTGPVFNFPAKIGVQIHLNFSEKKLDQFQRQVAYYSKFTGANLKSSIIIYPNKGHMLHWTATSKILETISNFCKFS